ncbi:MAG: NUDIX hydrolase [Colwellia sp.]|nr:NUDIX hydrolase [Colwellia sp.]
MSNGKVETGESVVQTAIREMSEETDINVELTRLVGVYSLPIGLVVTTLLCLPLNL